MDLADDKYTASSDNESVTSRASITQKRSSTTGNSPPKMKKKMQTRSNKNLPPPPSQLGASTSSTTSKQHFSTQAVENNIVAPPGVISYNPFSPIAVPDEMEAAPSAPAPQREPKPPPIYVRNVTKFSDLCGVLSNLVGKDAFTFKARITDLVINPSTTESYRMIIRYLSEKRADYHTYQLQSEKAYRVVIRYLHQSTPVEMIKEELDELGHKARNIAPVIHPVSKQTLPLFFVDLDPGPNNKDIFGLEFLCYTKIKVEEPNKQRNVIQCKRCQEYGHSKSYCKHRPRCVKCAGEHLTTDCGKQRTTPAKCALCNGEHPANYRGCIVHRELQRTKRPSVVPVYNHPSAPKREVTNPATTATQQPANLPPMPQQSRAAIRDNLSYARVISGLPPPQPPSQTTPDISTLLNSFLSDFKALITPLISLLTNVVNCILPRIAP